MTPGIFSGYEKSRLFSSVIWKSIEDDKINYIAIEGF